MILMAVESSCDETAVALVEDGRRILTDCIASQVDLHRIYGGVVPEIASRKHIEKINQVEEGYTKDFSNTQKILLTTDGSITAILDVLYGKITLSTLEQHFDTADREISELIHVDEGAQINYREVIMHKDDENLIYALSYIPLERLTDEICCDLVRADIPIGLSLIHI